MFDDPNRMSGRGASSSSARYENLRSRGADLKSLLPGNERPLVVIKGTAPQFIGCRQALRLVAFFICWWHKCHRHVIIRSMPLRNVTEWLNVEGFQPPRIGTSWTAYPWCSNPTIPGGAFFMDLTFLYSWVYKNHFSTGLTGVKLANFLFWRNMWIYNKKLTCQLRKNRFPPTPVIF